MNVLITSGGTVERIDAVRSISNFSTGTLGSLIAAEFASRPGIGSVYYMCSSASLKPSSEKAEVINVESVSSVEAAIRQLLGRASIDIIIHSMAVSDYRVCAVSSAAALAETIASNLDTLNKMERHAAAGAIVDLLRDPASALSSDGKISSNVDGMLLHMERTPKLITLFKELAPGSTLVGFKLLDGSPLGALIEAGLRVLDENNCSFVLANDLTEIKGERHVGYLIDRTRSYTKYETKADIATAIASATINERTGQK